MIKTKPATDAYRSGWERTFGGRNSEEEFDATNVEVEGSKPSARSVPLDLCEDGSCDYCRASDEAADLLK